MKIIWAVFKKEGLDTIRDRRSIIAMIVIPMVIFPVLFGGIGFFAIKETKKAQEKQVHIGLVQPVPDNSLVTALKEKEGFTVTELEEGIDPFDLIETTKTDAIIVFDSAFDENISSKSAGKMTLHYRSTGNGGIMRGRINSLVNDYRDEVREARVQELGYTLDFINPVNIEFKDTATEQEQVGEAIGGLIPYIFIMLCFTGAMYPAIDLGAGEKERGTLETLLTASAPLVQIIMGKLMLIVCSGLFAASLSVTSMAIALVSMGPMLGKISSSIGPMLNPLNILLFFSLLLPLTVFFASFLLTLSFFAKSFKEAQSIVSPMVAVIVFPLLFGMMPWMKLTYVTAMVPILNISLASKAIFSGNIPWGPVLVVYISLIAFASIGFVACTKLAGRESILFRS
ncbi:MAG: ABC transporter permease [Verrucomicrobia bacterium]|nr:ABC transporter permease [Verrucomicrobiota bacterium]MDA1065102.1 ABC transporter permease [Verrucomicrobiota bacterium]